MVITSGATLALVPPENASPTPGAQVHQPISPPVHEKHASMPSHSAVHTTEPSVPTMRKEAAHGKGKLANYRLYDVQEQDSTHVARPCKGITFALEEDEESESDYSELNDSDVKLITSETNKKH